MGLRYGAALWGRALRLLYGAALWGCAMGLRYGMRYGAVQWEIKARYGAVQWEIKARYGAVLMPPSPVRGWVPPLGTNIYPVGQKGFGTTPGSIAAIGPRPHCVRLGSPHGEVGGGG